MAPVVAVFAGGTSSERAVSLDSGRACAAALARSFPTRLFLVDADALPAGLDPRRHVVFSMLHGTFGEDGGMQALLDAAGVAYTGNDARASAVMMDKARVKRISAERGVSVAEGMLFNASDKPSAAEVAARLGPDVVLKPNSEGSSIGLCLAGSPAALEAGLASIAKGDWIAERRIFGRELSVGILDGRAMGVVEIRPHSGVYDYASKYTKGMTDYLSPAPLEPAATEAVRRAAETVFSACGGRDYARVDFIMDARDVPFLLEINPLPGMKETSLLPKSAGCAGLDFTALVREMTLPAIARFEGRKTP
jgi:D-alanine-D-alanine ligase